MKVTIPESNKIICNACDKEIKDKGIIIRGIIFSFEDTVRGEISNYKKLINTSSNDFLGEEQHHHYHIECFKNYVKFAEES
jgi:hypothetical protein